MRLPRYLTSLALLLLGSCLCVSARGVSPPSTCDPNKLTVYKVLVQTAWSREVFPKQYPEWRPPAQWSKVVGRSHDSSFKLFRMGETSSDGLKQFAEQGQTEVLDAHSQGEGGVLDEFNAPPVSQGVGETRAEFFVDGNHSRVSLISRVVPSPDWFIGVDSFELCVESKWLDSVVLEVDPLDAGTDNGFTFTSPNWPTIPRKPVSRITAQSPDHPANSFYYPDVEEHPPIASFQIVKVKEYELSHVFSPSLSRSSSTRRYSSSDLDDQTNARRRTGDRGESNNSRRRSDEGDNEVSNSILPESQAASSGTGKHTLLNNIVNKYKKKFRKNRRGRKMGQGRKLNQRRRMARRKSDGRVSATSMLGHSHTLTLPT